MNQDLDTNFLQDTPWFRDLDRAILQDLLAITRLRSLSAGETLFSAGQPFHGDVYILRSGVIEVLRPGVGIERPPVGYFLGLSSYLADTPYVATAMAVTSAELLVVTGSALWELEHRHPALFDALNRLIARRLQERSVSHAPVSGVLMQPVMEVMGTPLTTCEADTNLRDAFQMMRARKVGSLPVIDEAGALLGLVTYPSLTARLMDTGADPDREWVRNALRKAGTIKSTTPLWRAEEILERERVKHLVVTEDDRPVGMLSLTDIAHALVSRLGSLRATVKTFETLDDLAEMYRRMGDVALETRETNRRARTAVRILSELHIAIQCRCLEITAEKMAAEGWGAAPIPYAFIVMGSGGRKEMMLNPDQDNGIILADHPEWDTKKVKSWFQAFCERANENLDRIGYILCPGDIMARNAAYHKSLAEWKAQIYRLTEQPNQKAARFSNIFFDFRTLYGDEQLTRELRSHLHAELAAKPRLLQYMVQDDAEGRPALNLFNQLITHGERGGGGKVDVKRNGLRIVADAARILALQAGIGNCNTIDRLNALVREGVLSADFAATVIAAYDELLDVTLSHQIGQYQDHLLPDKLVDPKNLRPPEREALRVAMRAVKRFQDLLNDKIGTVALPF